VFVGLVQGDVTFHDPDFHRREQTLIASRNATGADFEQSIALIEAGGPDVTAWVTDRSTLAELPVDFPRWATPGSGTFKALVEI
jgi:threonine dehydrogenase-like Zn-dependent dehydrogenase